MANKDPEKLAEKNKAYHAAHRDEIIARKKAYCAANPEKIAARKKTYNAAHREEIAAWEKAYNKAHEKELKAKRQARYDVNQNEILTRARARRAAHDKGAKGAARKRDNNTCQLCGLVWHRGDGSRLPVHHINYIDTDNRPENLITLCHSCHGQTNGKAENRIKWQAYFEKVFLDGSIIAV